jgi:hypothetical protein
MAAPTKAQGVPPPPSSFQMAPIAADVTYSDADGINAASEIDDRRLQGRTCAISIGKFSKGGELCVHI